MALAGPMVKDRSTDGYFGPNYPMVSRPNSCLASESGMEDLAVRL